MVVQDDIVLTARPDTMLGRNAHVMCTIKFSKAGLALRLTMRIGYSADFSEFHIAYTFHITFYAYISASVSAAAGAGAASGGGGYKLGVARCCPQRDPGDRSPPSKPRH